mgnify:CR=1 FL=1
MTGTILIYANCQGEELLLTGGYLPSLADRIAFSWPTAAGVVLTR